MVRKQLRKRDPIRTLPPMTATLIGYARCPTDRQDPAAPRQGEIARQAAQTVRPTAVGTLPHACHRRVFHQRSRRALLRLKTNGLSHTQPAPFLLAYDPAPYRNRPVTRGSAPEPGSVADT